MSDALFFRRLTACAAMMLCIQGLAAQTPTEMLGLTVIEVESFTTNASPRSGHQWETSTSVTSYSGTGYMVTTPNTGTNLDAGFHATSPELQFPVQFTASGTKYVWVRGQGPSGADDSVHIGLNGASGSAERMTLNTVNAWQWTNTVQGSGSPATISVPSAGLHTLNVWMREDGFLADRIVLTTNSAFAARAGNCWHIPTNAEPAATPSMRNPLNAITPGTSVTIYSGNQFQGPGGDPGNQTQTGSAILYRQQGSTTWTTAQMFFHSESGNNKYYSGTIPTTGLVTGGVVEYYLRIMYDTHLPTYVYGSDSVSNKSELESVAQASPFKFAIQAPLLAAGPALTVSDDPFEGRIYEQSGHIELAGPDLGGAPLATTATFSPAIKVSGLMHPIGQVLASNLITSGIELVQSAAGTTVGTKLHFMEHGVLRYEVTNWNGLTPTEFTLTSPSGPSEHFYGFGEKFNSFDQAGNTVKMESFDQPGAKGDASYKVAPWFLSTGGYGYHLDNTAESWFDMCDSAADRYSVRSMGSNLRCNLVGGPRLTDALIRFTGYTGRPPLPPAWVFGPWMSTDIWRDGGEVRYVVSKLRDLRIPTSVFVFDSPWEVGYNDFTWNTAQFAAGGTYESTPYSGFTSPTLMLDFLRSHGMKAVLWLTPFVNVSSVNEGIPGQNTGQAANYAFGAANNYFVRSSPGGPPLVVPWWKGSGSPIDFTNPAAAQWFVQQLSALVEESKVPTAGSVLQPVIGGFKTDDGEVGNGVNTYIPYTASYYDGRTGHDMRNGFCVEYHKTAYSVLGTTGILFTRSGFTGTQAYPAGWSGDNNPNYSQSNGLQSVIVAAKSAAMSGHSIWASDVGGYNDGNYEANTSDLFMRWTQFGAFSPIMQMHRQVGSGRQYPWSYSAAALENYREYAELHTRLFPYIYAYALESAITGLPIIRPPVLLHQEDPNTHGLQHTYYFGNEMLVAPMNTATSTSRNVYLPSGLWHDFWTTQTYTGGQVVTWTNLDVVKCPVFVAEGAIIPMLKNVPQTLCDADYVNDPLTTTPDSALSVRVFPSADETEFIMADGTQFTLVHGSDITTATVNGAARAVEFVSREAIQPIEMRVNNVPVVVSPSKAAYEVAAGSAWFYDASAGSVLAKVNHGGGSATVAWGSVPLSARVTLMHID